MAVYTKLNDQEVKEILANYNLPKLISHSEISEGVENSNFLLQNVGQKYVMTIFEKRVQQQDLPFYIKLMQHLRQKNIPCPDVIANKNNDYLFYFKNKTGLILSFVEGKTATEVSKDICTQLGGFLASFHLAVADFPLSRTNDFSINKINDIFSQLTDKIPHKQEKEIKQILDDINQQELPNMPRGIIHADLFPDNLFFTNNKISAIIDFYFACTDYLIYDLAICINAWCFAEKDKIRSLIAGYEQVRPLNSAEKQHLKTMCQIAALRFFSTRLYDLHFSDPNALVQHKDPQEYFEKIIYYATNKDIY